MSRTEPPVTISRRTLLASVGGVLGVSTAGCLDRGEPESPGELSLVWESEERVTYEGNHHAMTAATVDGKTVFAVPRNDVSGSDRCGIAAYDDSGARLWADSLPPDDCHAHAIGDLGVGDLSGDGRQEFLAATYSGDVIAYDAETGTETFREELIGSLGYSAPVVASIDSARPGPELVVVDFEGGFSVVRPDGSVVVTREFEQPVFDSPLVGDITGDGSTNVAVNHGRFPNEVVCLDEDFEVEWRTQQERATLSWLLVRRNETPEIALVDRNTVKLLDGATGTVLWETRLHERLRELFVGAADEQSLYVSAPDGNIRAFDLDTGELTWSEPISDTGERMPPLTIGSVADGDSPSIVAAGYEGTIAVFDQSGSVLARTQLDADLFTRPITTDVTGNGRDDVVVLYGDARVGAVTYETR